MDVTNTLGYVVRPSADAPVTKDLTYTGTPNALYAAGIYSCVPVFNTNASAILQGVGFVNYEEQFAAGGLTTLSLPWQAISHSATFQNMQSLTTLSMPNLRAILSALAVRYTPSLTTLSLPLLEYAGGFSIYQTPLTTISFPNLRVSILGADIRYNHQLTTLSLPELVRIERLYCMVNARLTSLSAPKLTSATYMLLSSLPVTSLSFPLLASGCINVNTCPSLTAISLPSFVNGIAAPQDGTGGLQISSNVLLSTISCPVLATAVNINVSGASNTVLTTLAFPALTSVSDGGALWRHDSGSYGQMTISTWANLTSLSLPLLASVAVYLTINTCAALTSLSLPALASVGAFTTDTAYTFINGSTPPTVLALNTMALCTSISLPALATVTGNIVINTMAQLTTVSMPALVRCGTITANSSLGNITTFTIGAVGTTKSLGTTINVSSQKLTQGAVDAILAVLASLDGTNGTTSWAGTVTLNGGTNSTPSAAGLTSKATIVGRGGTVTNN